MNFIVSQERVVETNFASGICSSDLRLDTLYLHVSQDVSSGKVRVLSNRETNEALVSECDIAFEWYRSYLIT